MAAENNSADGDVPLDEACFGSHGFMLSGLVGRACLDVSCQSSAAVGGVGREYGRPAFGRSDGGRSGAENLACLCLEKRILSVRRGA